MTRVTIDTSSVSKCELAHLGGCDPQPLIRHHMGNDGLLKLACAKIRETYWQFLDCAKICDTHHMKVHYVYEVTIGIPVMSTMTQAQLIDLRSKYIELFYQIKSGAVKLKKVPKSYKSHWKASRKKWQTRQRQKKS